MGKAARLNRERRNQKSLNQTIITYRDFAKKMDSEYGKGLVILYPNSTARGAIVSIGYVPIELISNEQLGMFQALKKVDNINTFAITLIGNPTKTQVAHIDSSLLQCKVSMPSDWEQNMEQFAIDEHKLLSILLIGGQLPRSA